jgi:hypothetical protein
MAKLAETKLFAVDRTKLFIEDAFQGKLEIPPSIRLKGPMPETRSPEEALAAAEGSEENDVVGSLDDVSVEQVFFLSRIGIEHVNLYPVVDQYLRDFNANPTMEKLKRGEDPGVVS